VTDDRPEARLYGWVALSDSINIELNAALYPGSVLTVSSSSDEHVPRHVTPRRKRFKPSLNAVSEHMVSLMKHVNPNSRFIANVSTKAPLYKSMYKVWDRLPPPRNCSNLGLGATHRTPARPPLSKRLGPEQLANSIRARHKLFVAQTPAEPSIVIVAATMPIHHSMVTNTPASGSPRHCLFVEEFIICRARGQSNYVSDDSFRVPRALADTGAGPSVDTTELLSSLPTDASVIRDYDETNTHVCGPDGRALTTAGHATIVFTLAGLACRHRFLVVEGSSMVLLGNDFLHSRGATINLSIPGPCSMTLLTRQDDRKAHTVPVTTIPPGGERLMALTLSEEPKALAPTTKMELIFRPLRGLTLAPLSSP